MHACMPACIHAYMHTYIRTYACMYVCMWEAAEKALPEGGRITGAPWGPALSRRYKPKACQTPTETMRNYEI